MKPSRQARWCGFAAALAVFAVLGACGGGPGLSPEQRTVIETREIDAARAGAYRAVIGAMLDEGYMVVDTDFEAGLVVGAGKVGSGAPSAFVRKSASGSLAGHEDASQVQVFLRETGPQKTTMRAQFFRLGVQDTSPQRASTLAANANRHVLVLRGKP